MGTLAVGAVLTAAGVSFSGYRDTPKVQAKAAGKTLNGPEGANTDPLSPRLFDRSDPVRVHVAGAVRKPGVYSLPAWARVVDAVKKAGGPSPAADLDAINLADFLKDGEQVRIPLRGRPEARQNHPPAPQAPVLPPTVGGHGLGRYPFTRTAGQSQEIRTAGPVDLNSATAEELEGLPGVGPSTAAAILDHRREHGPFLRVEDLMNVRGIGPSRFEKLRPLVAVP